MFDYMRSCPATDRNCKRPNRYTYEALILAAGNAGKLDDAFAIFSDMVEDGFAPDASSFTKLVLACGLCHDLVRGQQCVDSVLAQNIPKTSFFYHSMIDLYSRCGQLDRAVAGAERGASLRLGAALPLSLRTDCEATGGARAVGRRGRVLEGVGRRELLDVPVSDYGLLQAVSVGQGGALRRDDGGGGAAAVLVAGATRGGREEEVKTSEEQHVNWSDMDFNLDFDLDANASLF